MSIQTQLFESTRLRLGPIDHEKDPEVESRWTHDLVFLHGMSLNPARPLSPAQMKKKYEAIEKSIEESHTSLHFMVHSKEDERLIGLALLKKFGFVEEVRRRKAMLRDGQCFDLIHLGLLQNEWQPVEENRP